MANRKKSVKASRKSRRHDRKRSTRKQHGGALSDADKLDMFLKYLVNTASTSKASAATLTFMACMFIHPLLEEDSIIDSSEVNLNKMLAAKRGGSRYKQKGGQTEAERLALEAAGAAQKVAMAAVVEAGAEDKAMWVANERNKIILKGRKHYFVAGSKVLLGLGTAALGAYQAFFVAEDDRYGFNGLPLVKTKGQNLVLALGGLAIAGQGVWDVMEVDEMVARNLQKAGLEANPIMLVRGEVLEKAGALVEGERGHELALARLGFNRNVAVAKAGGNAAIGAAKWNAFGNGAAAVAAAAGVGLAGAANYGVAKAGVEGKKHEMVGNIIGAAIPVVGGLLGAGGGGAAAFALGSNPIGWGIAGLAAAGGGAYYLYKNGYFGAATPTAAAGGAPAAAAGAASAAGGAGAAAGGAGTGLLEALAGSGAVNAARSEGAAAAAMRPASGTTAVPAVQPPAPPAPPLGVMMRVGHR